MTTPAAAFEAVTQTFPALKENKKRETVRLVFEIAKRDSIPPSAILQGLEKANFHQLKAALLKRRYPSLYGKVSAEAYYLPGLASGAPAPVYTPGDMPLKFYPKQIFVEAEAEGTPLALRAQELFPNSKFYGITTVSDFLKSGGLADAGYHNRHEKLFLFKERFDFIKPCPCTKGCVSCGYNVLNLGFGCVFDCEYCFLQEYQNFPAIALPCNAEDFLARIADTALTRGPFSTTRIGSGEFTDSLVFDHITNWAETITQSFKNTSGITFEFKTKSVNCGAFFKMQPADNVVISWSLNPPETECEHFAAPVELRIETAAQLAKLGWRVGFHFDPMVLYKGWQDGYTRIAAQLLTAVPPENIAWISAGTLRFRPPLKKVIESRFPKNTILDSELVQGFDGKMRYSDAARAAAYRTLKKAIDQNGGAKIPFYLCMENADMWRTCGISPTFS